MKDFVGIFGHTAIDVILEVPCLPEPNTSIGLDKETTRYGGTGANIARNLAEMGVPVSLASFVGDDFPVDYKEALEKSGVDIYDLTSIDGENTTKCWIITDEGENQMAIVDQGAMYHAERYEIQKRTIENSEIVHIGTGRPEYYKKVIDHARKLNKKIYFDPAQELKYVYKPDILKDFIQKCDLFFCNEKELEIVMDYLELEKTNDLFDLIDRFIVTEGSKGSSLFYNGEEIDIPPFKPHRIKEPTGAGDAYRAGFYASLYRGYDLEECCRIASARASFAVESAGPQEDLIGWGELLDRYEKVNTM